jgi:hypothetical protein
VEDRLTGTSKVDDAFVSWEIPAMRLMPLSCVLVVGVIAAEARADSPAHELVDEAKELLIVGACADGTPTKVSRSRSPHLQDVRKVQRLQDVIAEANPFFAANVPADRRRSSIRSPAAICRRRSWCASTPTIARSRSSPPAIRALAKLRRSR